MTRAVTLKLESLRRELEAALFERRTVEYTAAGAIETLHKIRELEETTKTAHLIASKGKVSLRSVKQCIDRGYDADLRRGCQMESDHFGLCMSSPDAKEGMSAFLEKRKPDFREELS